MTWYSGWKELVLGWTAIDLLVEVPSYVLIDILGEIALILSLKNTSSFYWSSLDYCRPGSHFLFWTFFRRQEEERQRLEEERQRREEEEALRLAAEARKLEEERLQRAIEAEEKRRQEEAERQEKERIEVCRGLVIHKGWENSWWKGETLVHGRLINLCWID